MGWSQVAICDVSAHGMRLRAEVAPKAGTYIELKRSAMLIIARIVWSDGHFFGICAQELIDLAHFVRLGEVPRSTRQAPRPLSPALSKPRLTNAESTRAMEFVLLAALLIIGGIVLARAEYQMLERPIHTVARVLGGG